MAPDKLIETDLVDAWIVNLQITPLTAGGREPKVQPVVGSSIVFEESVAGQPRELARLVQRVDLGYP